uniref:Phytocyanin domain-containing protein n=1 Tax=Aegilops tauschii subsp. strangulata TaxID=200361 RepID=A0A453ADZ0_AEGTS
DQCRRSLTHDGAHARGGDGYAHGLLVAAAGTATAAASSGGRLHHLCQRQEDQSQRHPRVQLRRRGAQRGGGERGGLRVALSSDGSGATTIALKTTEKHYFICGVTGHCSNGMMLAVDLAAAAAEGGPDPGHPRHPLHHPNFAIHPRRHAQDPGDRARAPDQAVGVRRHRTQGHGDGWPGHRGAGGRGV